MLIFGAAQRLAHVADQRRASADEGTYAHYTELVARMGRPALRLLSEDYLQQVNPTSPPPSRVLLVALSAVVSRGFGTSPAAAVRWLSCAASCVGLLVLAWFAWRAFGLRVAVLANWMMSVFPPDLAIARRGWTDALVATLSIAAFASAWLVAERPTGRRCATFVGLGMALAATKESSVLTWGACALPLLLIPRRRSRTLVIACLAGGAATAAVLSWLVGGAGTLLRLALALRSGHLANSYVRTYQSGSPLLMLKALWMLNPWTTLLAAVGVCSLVLVRDRRQQLTGLALAALLVVDFLVLPSVMAGWTNLRIASPSYVPLCLLAALGIIAPWDRLATTMGPHTKRILVGLLIVRVVLGGATDVHRFTCIIVAEDVLDLTPPLLFEGAAAAADR